MREFRYGYILTLLGTLAVLNGVPLLLKTWPASFSDSHPWRSTQWINTIILVTGMSILLFPTNNELAELSITAMSIITMIVSVCCVIIDFYNISYLISPFLQLAPNEQHWRKDVLQYTLPSITICTVSAITSYKIARNRVFDVSQTSTSTDRKPKILGTLLFLFSFLSMINDFRYRLTVISKDPEDYDLLVSMSETFWEILGMVSGVLMYFTRSINRKLICLLLGLSVHPYLLILTSHSYWNRGWIGRLSRLRENLMESAASVLIESFQYLLVFTSFLYYCISYGENIEISTKHRQAFKFLSIFFGIISIFSQISLFIGADDFVRALKRYSELSLPGLIALFSMFLFASLISENNSIFISISLSLSIATFTNCYPTFFVYFLYEIQSYSDAGRLFDNFFMLLDSYQSYIDSLLIIYILVFITTIVYLAVFVNFLRTIKTVNSFENDNIITKWVRTFGIIQIVGNIFTTSLTIYFALQQITKFSKYVISGVALLNFFTCLTTSLFQVIVSKYYNKYPLLITTRLILSSRNISTILTYIDVKKITMRFNMSGYFVIYEFFAMFLDLFTIAAVLRLQKSSSENENEVCGYIECDETENGLVELSSI